MEKNRKYLVAYLLRMRWVLLWVCGFAGAFALICVLAQIPMEAVSYTLELAGAFGLIGLCSGYGRYRSQAVFLEKICEDPASALEVWPETKDPAKAACREALNRLVREKTAQHEADERRYQDAVEYYAMWAHQIKTPIAAMDLLLQQEEGGQTAELRAELFKIEQYVQMALQYLRIDSITSDLDLKKQSLDDILHQAVKKYAPLFIAKKLALVYSDVDTEVLTDGKWLEFVIGQILSNAVKYTRKGSVAIYMSDTEPKTLVIADTGIGIAGEDLPRVFEKGYTGYNGHEDKRSTGLGLYMCRQILTKLSHTIRIESEPGCGTQVYIGLDTVKL